MTAFRSVSRLARKLIQRVRVARAEQVVEENPAVGLYIELRETNRLGRLFLAIAARAVRHMRSSCVFRAFC